MNHYIYCNYYKVDSQILLYVGSHSWNGPYNMLDSFYKGQSTVAKSHNWVPYKQRILEAPFEKSRLLLSEREWILRYARWVGVSPLVSLKSSFVLRYQRPNGRLLNCFLPLRLL